LLRARCSSSCRQQIKTSERHAIRVEREDEEIKEKIDDGTSPGKRATLGRHGSAAPRATLD
jgi:hypothetical protein